MTTFDLYQCLTGGAQVDALEASKVHRRVLNLLRPAHVVGGAGQDGQGVAELLVAEAEPLLGLDVGLDRLGIAVPARNVGAQGCS